MSSNVPEMPINTEILKQCREQMGLSLEQVKKRVASIEKIEQGEKKPSFKQLDQLEELYQVPSWALTKEELPEQYRYYSRPSFRLFRNTEKKDWYSLRKLLISIAQYRKLALELREDIEEPIPKFSSPEAYPEPEKTAQAVRKWLNLDEALGFDQLRQRLEQHNIFVSVTSGKGKGKWSYLEKESMRGLSIYEDTLPIIIINGADDAKAQSFTLMHELGHLLKKATAMDEELEYNTSSSKKEETWCNKMAAAVLMPNIDKPRNLQDVQRMAKKMKVNPSALLIRMRNCGKIEIREHDTYIAELQEEHREQAALKTSKKEQALKRPIALDAKKTALIKESQQPTPTDIMKEPEVKAAKKQFGSVMLNTFLDAYNSDEMSLHKVSMLLDIKPRQVLKLARSSG